MKCISVELAPVLILRSFLPTLCGCVLCVLHPIEGLMSELFLMNPYLYDTSVLLPRSCPECNPCVFPNNTLVVICEMVLDTSECKCFAFDSNDGIHWSAIGLCGFIVCLVVYIVYRHRQNKKRRDGGRSCVLPLHEILPK